MDKDSIVSKEDKVAISEYRKEKAAGELVSHEKVKKDLGF